MKARLVMAALAALGGAVALGGAAVVACGPAGFPDENLINSVRILASQSDQSYAKPGATVHSQVLAVDARPDAAGNEPMHVFWLPFVCVNPANDAFYACFSQFESNPSAVAQTGIGDGGTTATISGAISSWDGTPDAGVTSGLGGLALGDGGTGHDGGIGGLLSSLPAGTDISPYLVQGARAVFRLPSDIVASHPPAKGAIQYGLAVVFNIACAGHVELIPLDPTSPNPEQIPFGCFNTQHQQLGADSYVIGYTEVFAYTSLTNANPVISSFSFEGNAVAVDAGGGSGIVAPITLQHCPAGTKKCPDNYAIIGVPDASWERDPQDSTGDGGTPLGEQIWVDYYATLGSLGDDAILIFDPTEGRVTVPHQEDFQTSTVQTGTMWAVVHDNRGGAAWVTIPVKSQ